MSFIDRRKSSYLFFFLFFVSRLLVKQTIVRMIFFFTLVARPLDHCWSDWWHHVDANLQLCNRQIERCLEEEAQTWEGGAIDWFYREFLSQFRRRFSLMIVVAWFERFWRFHRERHCHRVWLRGGEEDDWKAREKNEFTILLFLSITWWFFQSFDDEWWCRWDHIDFSITILYS